MFGQQHSWYPAVSVPSSAPFRSGEWTWFLNVSGLSGSSLANFWCWMWWWGCRRGFLLVTLPWRSYLCRPVFLQSSPIVGVHHFPLQGSWGLLRGAHGCWLLGINQALKLASVELWPMTLTGWWRSDASNIWRLRSPGVLLLYLLLLSLHSQIVKTENNPMLWL